MAAVAIWWRTPVADRIHRFGASRASEALQ